MERTLSEEEADELAKNKLCLVYTLTKSGNCTKLHFGQVLSSDNLTFLILEEIVDLDLGQALTKCALMEEFTKSSI